MRSGAHPCLLVRGSPRIPHASFIFPLKRWKNSQSTAERSRNGKIGPMPTATNLSSTRRTVRALRKQERLTEANAALAQLALTTAAALDETRSRRTDDDTPPAL